MKKELRKNLKKIRNDLENKELLSDSAAKLFLESDLYKESGTLLLYSSCAGELSTGKIFARALHDNKAVAFPVCTDSEGTMEFFYVESENDLVTGMYGIKAPSVNCKRFEGAANALCIVPGLSFDKKGYRIGYGKGYYDRFLETFIGISAGLCYEQMVSEELPCDSYDKKVSYLITDKKIYKFNS